MSIRKIVSRIRELKRLLTVAEALGLIDNAKFYKSRIRHWERMLKIAIG